MKKFILALHVLTGGSIFVRSEPIISQQPTDQMITNGGTVTFSVAVAGGDSFACQWQFQNTNLPTATNTTLVLAKVQPRQSGAYSVIVSNSTGTVTSSNANLTVYGIFGWGDNTMGQLNVPVNLTNVVALAAGDYHVLALRSDGSVIAWGGNEFNFGETNVPLDLSNVVSIAAGSAHSLALKRDGTVVMWGRLFDGGITNVPPQATNVVALALGSGAQHGLVLKADGTVVEWNYNNPSLMQIPPAVRNIVSVASGAYHALALRADGTVIAWGTDYSHSTEVPASATNIVAIATGWYGNAAIRADGTVLNWGPTYSPNAAYTNLMDVVCPINNGFGPGAVCSILGLRRDGTTTGYSYPISPKYPTNYVSAIASGSYNAFALIASGPPFFSGLPVNRCVASGSSAYFHANAVGAIPMFYQWTCNGTNIPGATNTTFILTNVQPELIGSCYALIASNAFGVATNGPMILSEVPLESSVNSENLSAAVGSTASFSVVYTNGVGPFTFQWQSNGVDVNGATNSSFLLTDVQRSQSGIYSVVVSNVFGSVTNNATLSVQPFAFSANSSISTTGMVLRLDSVFAPQSVVIFNSTDLVNWLPIWTNPATTGSVIFVDAAAVTNSPQGFYRAIEQ